MPRLAVALGLSSSGALELVQRVPVVVAVPAAQLVLGVGGLAPTLGVEQGACGGGVCVETWVALVVRHYARLVCVELNVLFHIPGC